MYLCVLKQLQAAFVQRVDLISKCKQAYGRQIYERSEVRNMYILGRIFFHSSGLTSSFQVSGLLSTYYTVATLPVSTKFFRNMKKQPVSNIQQTIGYDLITKRTMITN